MASRGHKRAGLHILSLDGGGPGAISQLRIIKEFMGRLAHDLGVNVKTLHPADFLDLMGGSGFGGFIALMIGRLGLSVAQAEDELIRLATRLFPKGRRGPVDPEENTNKLRKAIEDMLERYGFPQDIKMQAEEQLPKSRSKVVLFTTPSANASHCQLLRTYPTREGNFDCTIVEAISATLAIPTLFSPVLIGPLMREQKFYAASLGYNNPIQEVIGEAERVFGSDKKASVILSIGSGRPQVVSLDPSLSDSDDLNNILTRMLADCEQVAQEIAKQLEILGPYLRLNVDRGVEEVQIFEWDKLGAIETHTTVYLSGTAITKDIDRLLIALQGGSTSATLGQLERSATFRIQAKTAPSLSPYFVNRRQLWDIINERLVISPPKGCKTLVLSGIAGGGKTQMASYFVRKHQSRFHRIFFVDASSVSSIESDLEAAIRSLGIAHRSKTFEDAIRYLANGADGSNWLLVMDNANKEVDLVKYLPECSEGTILITTRNGELGELSTVAHLEVGPMTDEEARGTLLLAAHRMGLLPSQEYMALKQLIKEVGLLAAALVQVGSYCYRAVNNDATRLTFDQFLRIFRLHRREIMKDGEVSPRDPDQAEIGVYPAFESAYSTLPVTTQQFLNTCCFLETASIPLGLFARAAGSGFSEPFELLRLPYMSRAQLLLREMLCPHDRWDEHHVQNIIQPLYSSSLITQIKLPTTTFLHINPLVRAWRRDMLSSEDTVLFFEVAMRIVVASSLRENVPFYQHLLPHIITLIKERPIEDIYVNDQMALGTVLNEMGYLSQAEDLLREVRCTLEWELGRNDRNTLRASECLASVLHDQGKLDEAEKIKRDVLERRQKTLGSDNLDTITASASLAITLGKRGRWAESERLEKMVLGWRYQNLGGDHADTISALANLATTYLEQGKHDQVLEWRLEVLERRERLFGGEHPDTLSALASLAGTYARLGKFDDAERHFLRVLRIRQETLGAEHPDSIITADDLALTYCSQGRLKDAENLQVQTLQILRQTKGMEHPETLALSTRLVATYCWQGRWGDAERLQSEVSEIMMRLKGTEDPETIQESRTLASIRESRALAQSSNTQSLVP